MSDTKLFFYKGQENVLFKEKGEENDNPIDKIRDSFSKVLDGKNLSFLLGCGCSSFVIEKEHKGAKNKVDIGIPTMVPLAVEFYSSVLQNEDKKWLKDKLNLNIEDSKFKTNIETFLGALHSIYFFYDCTGQAIEDKGVIKEEMPRKVHEIIKLTRNFLLNKCLNENNRKDGTDKPLIDLYKAFYRKMLYRNTNLHKPNIFTTNYDLYSELALDKLGIHYVNGFSGGIMKYFNPTIFNYALAEKMDLSQSKWSVIDNFFYLYKIHGSVNWIQDEEPTKLFRVREIQDNTFDSLKEKETIMIYPTPLKHNATLGSPYSDLFREFQKRLMQNNNVLVTLGYSFCDEHINNLIYQAFTIPSFRLIVIGDPDTSSEIRKLQSLNDPRIWIIGGELEDGSCLHYFKGFTEKILPDLSNDEIDDKIENAIRTLFKNDEQGG